MQGIFDGDVGLRPDLPDGAPGGVSWVAMCLSAGFDKVRVTLAVRRLESQSEPARASESQPEPARAGRSSNTL